MNPLRKTADLLTAVGAGAVLLLLACTLLAIFLGGLPLAGELLSDPEFWSASWNSLLLILITLLFLCVMGRYLACLIYLRPRSVLVRWVRFLLRLFTAVPSVAAGVMGQQVFGSLFGMSLLCGGCTMGLVLLPLFVFPAAEAMENLPPSLMEGALVLGADEGRGVSSLLWPTVASLRRSCCTLAAGRVLAESGALLLTAGMSFAPPRLSPDGLLSSGGTLAVYLYRLTLEGASDGRCQAAGSLLLAFALLISLVRHRLTK